MNSFVLKIIAMVTMIIDHTGVVFLRGDAYMIARIIGRTAFPIFAYMIAEGALHTRSRPKYLLRLFVLAWVSQIPYSLMGGRPPSSLSQLNIFFTLSLGLLAIMVFDAIFDLPTLHLWPKLLRGAVGLIPVLLFCWLGTVLHVDYVWRGVALIFAFHLAKTRWQTVLCVLGLFFVYQWPQLMSGRISQMYMGVPLAIPPLYFYNGKKGPAVLRRAFYLLYPAHMLILVLLKRIIIP